MLGGVKRSACILCLSALMVIGCQDVPLKLAVSSFPPNAELIVNGARVPALTPLRTSVCFTDREQYLQVTLMNGKEQISAVVGVDWTHQLPGPGPYVNAPRLSGIIASDGAVFSWSDGICAIFPSQLVSSEWLLACRSPIDAHVRKLGDLDVFAVEGKHVYCPQLEVSIVVPAGGVMVKLVEAEGVNGASVEWNDPLVSKAQLELGAGNVLTVDLDRYGVSGQEGLSSITAIGTDGNVLWQLHGKFVRTAVVSVVRIGATSVATAGATPEKR